MKEELDYKLNDPGETASEGKEFSKYKKKERILILIIVTLSIISIIFIILYFKKEKKDQIDKKDNGDKEMNPHFYLYFNIPTSENKLIRNSFINGRENYIEELGDLNNGKDYEETERNNFDLCIPNIAVKNKTSYKTIILNIHGGGWVGGNKPNALDLCKNYLNSGFIVATMSYTLLNGQYKEYNIFRIIDEITAVLKNLKRILKEQGFDENKLELIISGGSAGAHLSILYGYMIKNPIIPIKFILNLVGPTTLIPENFLTVRPGLEPLYNILPEDIENAKNNNSLVHMNGNETGVNMNNIYIMNFINAWLGKPLNDSFDKIFSNLEKKEINTSSEIYQERLRKARFGFPTTYVTKESIPTLCVYSGKDEELGVGQYAQLHKAFRDNNNEKNLTLCYTRYGMHDAFFNISKSESDRFLNSFTYYCQSYLNSVKNNN